MARFTAGRPGFRPGRRGSIFAALCFLGMLFGLGSLVMALSGQSSTARNVQATMVQGRYAGELAESALDECLAEFPRLMLSRTGGKDMRAVLMGQTLSAKVSPEQLGGAATFTYDPKRTLKMLEKERLGIKVMPVVVQLLYYSTLQNYGEVDITSYASFKLSGGRELFRRVTARHYFILNTDGRSFRINPVASQCLVDRSSES